MRLLKQINEFIEHKQSMDFRPLQVDIYIYIYIYICICIYIVISIMYVFFYIYIYIYLLLVQCRKLHIVQTVSTSSLYSTCAVECTHLLHGGEKLSAPSSQISLNAPSWVEAGCVVEGNFCVSAWVTPWLLLFQ